QISARRLMQLHQVDRFLRRKRDRGLDFVGHGRGGENGIGGGGVDERNYSQFFVVVRALCGAGRRGGGKGGRGGGRAGGWWGGARRVFGGSGGGFFLWALSSPFFCKKFCMPQGD